MGIRVSGADGSGSGRGASITDAARSGRSSTGAPSISQIQASHGMSASMSGSGNANSMELVYHGLNTTPNLPAQQPPISLTNPPSQYDTQLFGGQAVSSLTIPTVNPAHHPLLQNVQLAPVTSLQSNSSQRSNSGTPSSLSTSFIAGPGGQMMRVSDRDNVSGVRRPVPLAGWMDGGVSSGLNEEDFSISFGLAMDSFLQAASRAQANPASDDDAAVAQVNQENEEVEEAMEDGSADADNQAEEAPDAAADDDDDAADDDGDAAADDDDDEDPSDENNPVEESIEDRSAPVAEGMETGNNSSEGLPEGDVDMQDSNSTGGDGVPDDQDEEMADQNEAGHSSIENQNEEIAQREETTETDGGGDQAMGNMPGSESSNNVEFRIGELVQIAGEVAGEAVAGGSANSFQGVFAQHDEGAAGRGTPSFLRGGDQHVHTAGFHVDPHAT